jgi:hypothetical protein
MLAILIDREMTRSHRSQGSCWGVWSIWLRVFEAAVVAIASIDIHLDLFLIVMTIASVHGVGRH